MKKNVIQLLILLTITVILLPGLVFAKKTISDANNMLNAVAGETGVVFPASENNPGNKDIPSFVALIVKMALGVVAVTFFVLIVYAGMRWMLAQGKEDQITAARNTIVGASIGLVVIVSAYAFTTFIQTSLLEGKGGSAIDSTPDQVGDPFAGQPLGCCVYYRTNVGTFDVDGVDICTVMSEKECQLQNICTGSDGGQPDSCETKVNRWDSSIQDQRTCVDVHC